MKAATTDTERLVIVPQSKMHWLKYRTEDITSTDCAALFGISPYMTPFELWHRKKRAEIVTVEDNERMTWGTRLQDAIAAGICADNSWPDYRRKEEYIRWPALRMGASFDFEYTVGGQRRLLEIKNVDSLVFKEGWIVDGDEIQAPAHIELQVQHQLAVDNGAAGADIGALVGGNRVVIIKRDRDEHVISAIESRVKMFWDTIDSNIEPEPDFKRDAGFISKLYQYADPNKVLDATGNQVLETLVRNYRKAVEAANALAEEKDGYKAQMLTIIGDAAKVTAADFSISAGLIGPTHVEYDRAGYRDFRIYLKKQKGSK